MFKVSSPVGLLKKNRSNDPENRVFLKETAVTFCMESLGNRAQPKQTLRSFALPSMYGDPWFEECLRWAFWFEEKSLAGQSIILGFWL